MMIQRDSRKHCLGAHYNYEAAVTFHQGTRSIRNSPYGSMTLSVKSRSFGVLSTLSLLPSQIYDGNYKTIADIPF